MVEDELENLDDTEGLENLEKTNDLDNLDDTEGLENLDGVDGLDNLDNDTELESIENEIEIEETKEEKKKEVEQPTQKLVMEDYMTRAYYMPGYEAEKIDYYEKYPPPLAQLKTKMESIGDFDNFDMEDEDYSPDAS